MLKRNLAPSLLSADFSKLEVEIREMESYGVDCFHVDVMDGHFVPNLTMGPAIVKSVRKITTSYLDCHLMVTHPEKWIDPFLDAGADGLTLHVESAGDLEKSFEKIRAAKKTVGITFNPDTPLETIEPFLDQVDLVLVMSVFPGFSGQKFMPEVLKKMEELKNLQSKYSYKIEIDGGIGLENLDLVLNAGAEMIVSGSSVFQAKDRKKTVEEMLSKISRG